MAESGRILGLDLGDARIGVAISDPENTFAVPFGTIPTGPPDDMRSIARIAEENGVSEVVVGHPLSMSGAAGPRARMAEEFAGALRSFLGITVTLHDERLSTVEAERTLSAAGAGGRRRRRVVDRSAATVILQSFLDSRS
ncbi:MAG: Holliday junction resolvase RuvX [Actinomycetota bacterium]